jgi:hypothetical protein
MATEHIPTNCPAVKDADFRITGPGRYRDAGGGIAIVTGRVPFSETMWAGTDSDGDRTSWADDGTWASPKNKYRFDLVAGPLADETGAQD